MSVEIQNRYEKKIAFYRIEEVKKRKISRIYLIIKLISFLGIIVFGYLIYRNSGDVYWLGVALSLLAYIAFYVLDNRCLSVIELLRRKETVCRNEIKYLNGDFSAFDAGNSYVDIHHGFSCDLDIFGPASLFHRINRTITAKGRDTLAHKLSDVCQDKTKIVLNQEAIAELSSRLDWRIEYLSNPGIDCHLEQLSNQVLSVQGKSSRVYEPLAYISVAVTLTTLVLALCGLISFAYFFAMFSVQLFVAVLFGKSILKTFVRVDRLHKEYLGYLSVLQQIHQEPFESELLRNLKGVLFENGKNSIDAFQKLSSILHLFDQRGNIILYLLFNGCFLYDILLLRMFEKWSRKYLPYVEDWVRGIGEMDALVSLATYAYNNPQNRYPQLLDDSSEEVISAIDVYHPFLAYDKAVVNSFTLKKNHVAIITGANMAGKSTFLRTIGVTLLLASNGVPVCARRFDFSTVSLFSSMRTTDNLSADISYFNAELLRLKQLLEYVQQERFTLIILDEILKGTNSKDKLSGSILFLEKLEKYPVSAIIATHDLELARLEEKNRAYINYCFEIGLSEEISYSYKIQRGVAKNLNATFLLQNILTGL